MTDASTTEAGRWREWPGPAEALEERSCELCGHDEAIQLHVENGFRILRCRQCRHVYVNPRPTRDALSDWYGRFFEALDADGIEGWRRQMSGVFHQAYRLAASSAREDDNRRRRVLDIGCSYGFLLEMFSAAEWDREGIELAAAAADYCRVHLGATVHEEALEDLGLPDAQYDVVTCIYLLEHVWDPLLMLSHVHRVLKPGGLLIGVVPQAVPAYGVKKLLGLDLLCPPFHLRDFSPESLARLLDQSGFSRVRVSPAEPTMSSNRLENWLLRLNNRVSRVVFHASAGRVMTPVGGKLVETWT
ncbi:MAG TPA: class I SAM-dependent methyltransferase [Vicinamibacterales bacterium]|nr:class I SAM-dependent methyltransferase [Vicinamibacterales bacterium]